MDSHVFAADFAGDQEGYSGDGRGPKISCSDQKQQVQRRLISPPSVSVLCSTCAQPRWESEWNFSIEDAVPSSDNNNTSFKRGDLMKDKEKAGKSQKMRRNMGRVFYHRPPRALLSP